MSSETLPISPARFAEAIRDLPAASLHLKTLELRNSLAHLAYSNAQLRPFAEGAQAALGSGGAPGDPDPDCADAIRENEAVMARMRARVALVRAEVEARGLSWAEFEAKDELEEGDGPGAGADAAAPGAAAAAAAAVAANGSSAALTNGANGHAADADAAAVDDTARGVTTGAERNPWMDGTFQTGVIRNGEVIMDAVHLQRSGEEPTTSTTEGAAGPGQGATGRSWLSDQELQRALELRLAQDGDDEDGGMHL